MSLSSSRADEETRKKEELVNQIKQFQKTLVTYHNDRNSLIEMLKQSRRYQQFLFKFATTVRDLRFEKEKLFIGIADQEWQEDIRTNIESICKKFFS